MSILRAFFFEISIHGLSDDLVLTFGCRSIISISTFVPMDYDLAKLRIFSGTEGGGQSAETGAQITENTITIFATHISIFHHYSKETLNLYIHTCKTTMSY